MAFTTNMWHAIGTGLVCAAGVRQDPPRCGPNDASLPSRSYGAGAGLDDAIDCPPSAKPHPAQDPAPSGCGQTDENVTTATAVWIATATLHMENRDRDAFALIKIRDRVEEQGLCSSKMSTIVLHISHYCVANTKAHPTTHRMLYRTRGGYRLYRHGDDYDPSRDIGQTEPSAAQLPEEYKHLVEWYHDEYQRP